MLSVIVPAYNEAGNISLSSKKLCKILESAKIPFEIIYVNDGSKDNTWQNILDEAKKNKNIKGLCFSRNFGKEAAIMAGLTEAKGDCCAVIDCDMQHPPEKLVEMYQLWKDGYEIIEGVKSDRGKESIIYKGFSKLFYGLISRATNTDLSRSSDFKLMDRKVVDVIINIREKNAFFRALSSWVGFKSTQVEYAVKAREIGESKWSKGSLVKYAVTNIMSFTTVPMQIVTILGILTLVATTVFTVISFCQKVAGIALGGFTTLIVLQGFTSSVIMISLGIIGCYIAKIYEEVKERPRYIISEKVNYENNRKN